MAMNLPQKKGEGSFFHKTVIKKTRKVTSDENSLNKMF